MYNILVCDDEKDIVSALNIYLSAEGYRVLTAFDGLEALRLLDREEEVAPEELLPLFRWDKLPRKDLTLSIGEKI